MSASSAQQAADLAIAHDPRWEALIADTASEFASSVPQPEDAPLLIDDQDPHPLAAEDPIPTADGNPLLADDGPPPAYDDDGLPPTYDEDPSPACDDAPADTTPVNGDKPALDPRLVRALRRRLGTR